MSKPKAQGTAFETWIVKRLSTLEGVVERVWRLAEGGMHDQGDIEFWLSVTPERWVVEAKARERLNVPRELSKARLKSGVPSRTVLFWKRLTLKDGNTKRTPDGEPVVVCMGLDTFESLISRGGES